ncbi:MAG TPA: hypothetical protein VI585_14960 [Candidatus Binatia bacterium]
MRKKILMVVLLFLMAGTLMAQEPEVTRLVSKDVEVEFRVDGCGVARFRAEVVQQGRKTPGEVQRMSAPSISGTLQPISINR